MGQAELSNPHISGFSRRKKEREQEKAADLEREWAYRDWVNWHYRDTSGEREPRNWKGSRDG